MSPPQWLHTTVSLHVTAAVAAHNHEPSCHRRTACTQDREPSCHRRHDHEPSSHTCSPHHGPAPAPTANCLTAPSRPLLPSSLDGAACVRVCVCVCVCVC